MSGTAAFRRASRRWKPSSFIPDAHFHRNYSPFLFSHFPMSNILQEIERQIGSLKTATTKSNVGIVREVGDGVAKIEGLSDVMLNEMIDFGNGLYGLALNLEESEVGCILLGSDRDVAEGTEVKTTGRLLSVPVGKGLLGRAVDTLGVPVDGKGPIQATAQYPVEKIAPGIIKR